MATSKSKAQFCTDYTLDDFDETKNYHRVSVPTRIRSTSKGAYTATNCLTSSDRPTWTIRL